VQISRKKPSLRDTRVYVVPGFNTMEIEAMFYTEGYAVTKQIGQADIVVWTGGADVTPALYGERTLPGTDTDFARDKREMEVWRQVGPASNVMKIGICRGSQFLNVLNGGKLWQDVNGHGRSHPLEDIMTGKTVMVSSTHHQQFRPAADAVIVAVARMSTIKQADLLTWKKPEGMRENTSEAQDYEVLWYPRTRSLCFQPHPEYDSPKSTAPYFFEVLKRYF